MSSGEFPGTLLPILAICIFPPLTFVLIFFLCSYCILVRRTPSTAQTGGGGTPSPSNIRVQPAQPTTSAAPTTSAY